MTNLQLLFLIPAKSLRISRGTSYTSLLRLWEERELGSQLPFTAELWRRLKEPSSFDVFFLYLPLLFDCWYWIYVYNKPFTISSFIHHFVISSCNTGSLSQGWQAVICDRLEMEEQLKYSNCASEITCVLLIFFFSILKLRQYDFFFFYLQGLQWQYVLCCKWCWSRLDWKVMTAFIHFQFLKWRNGDLKS